MSDIAALEQRITAALDRIRVGLDHVAAADAAPQEAGDAADLRVQLDEEKTANAQLVERVRALKETQDGRLAELSDRVEAQRAQMAQLDAELQRLRASNADMRVLNAQLRAAASEHVGDAELINRAMMAEIDALQAQRSADAAEVVAVLAELAPLLQEEQSNAAG